MKNRLRAFYIALAVFLGFDVRFNRKGIVRFHLRDAKEEKKKWRKAKEKKRMII